MYTTCLREKALLGATTQSKAFISAVVETTVDSPSFPSRRPSSYRASCLQWKVRDSVCPPPLQRGAISGAEHRADVQALVKP